MHTELWWGNLLGRDHLEDREEDRVILLGILER